MKRIIHYSLFIIQKLTKKLIIAILALIVIGVPLIYLTVLNQKEALAAWFDDNFAYRQTVALTNSGSAQTDFQVSMTLDTATLITAGKMQSSCNDIRVTDINGKLLSFWIEDGTGDCNTSTTKIWTNVPSIPTSGATVYVYYGNPSATNVENPQQVFSYFENFENYSSTANITSAGWVDLSINNAFMAYNATNGSNSSKAMLLDPQGGSGWKRASTYLSGKPFSSGTVLEYFYKATNDNYYDGPSGFSDRTAVVTEGNDGAVGTNMVVFDGAANSPNDTLRTKSAGTQTSTAANVTRTGSHKVSIYWGSTSSFYFDGTQIATSTTNIPSTSLNIFLSQFPQDTDAGVGYFDDIRTRKFASTEPSVGSPASEEKAPGPIAYWKFDDGTGTTAQDSTQTNADGAISGATWQTEDQCVAGKCLFFDGTNDSVTVSNTVNGVQSVSFWVRPNAFSATTPLVQLTTSAYITANSSGVVSATGFTSPTIYVNGIVSSTLTANQWNFVQVTTGTAINANAIVLANQSTNYLKGFMDEVKLYTYARSASQIATDFASRGSSKGTSASFGSSDLLSKSLSNGLVGYWKMDESSGNRSDSSGNGNTLTDNATVTSNPGKFGNAGQFTAANLEYLSIADNASLSTGDIDFTIVAWVYFDSIPVAGKYPVIASKKDVSNSREYVLFSNGDTSGSFWFQTYQSGGDALDALQATNFGAPSTGTWYFVVAYHDSVNDKIGISVNAGIPNSMTTTGTIVDSTSSFIIGGDTGANGYWNGRIEEARFYKRVLSSAEITSLYNFAPGPRVYLKMDENTGTSTNDSSSNARTGTINGNPIWAPGKYGAGLKMDGTGDNIQVSDF